MFTPMPYFDPIPQTRDMASDRFGENLSLTCTGCKHRITFMTESERTRFMVSSNWHATEDPEKGLCPVCRDPKPMRMRKPLLG